MKAANVLDRTLRAKGTRAQYTAQQEVRTYSTRHTADDKKGKEHLEADAVIWGPDKLCILGLQQSARVSEARRQEKEGTIWEITKRRELQLKEVKQQRSKYHASAETIEDQKVRSETLFWKDEEQTGTNIAMSILMRTEWNPGVTYCQTTYLKKEKDREFFWWKIH